MRLLQAIRPACLVLVATFALGPPVVDAQSAIYNFADVGTVGRNSSGEAINSLNQFAGTSDYYAFGSFTENHATFWSGTTATDLTGCVPPRICGDAFSYAISDSGQVGGKLFAPSAMSGYNAYVWQGAGDLGRPSGKFRNSADVDGINNAGVAVGTTTAGAARWDGTTVTYLAGNRPNTIGFEAKDINNSGLIVGTSIDTGLSQQLTATLWNGTSVVNLGAQFGASNSRATAVNDVGQIVGQFFSGSTSHAVIWNGLVGTELGTLGGAASFAKAINLRGIVVGASQTASGAQHATLWDGASTIDLNDFLPASFAAEGWLLQTANGINDGGWIVGNAFNANTSLTHAFVLSPVPDPSVPALSFVGVCGLVAIGRCRARRRAV